MNTWLGETLAESRLLGLIGPGPIEPHVEHALGYLATWNTLRDRPPGSVLDLGSGGGLPGLVLAVEWSCPIVLVDSMIRRTSFLERAARAEGAPDGITVVLGRAETVSRDPAWEGTADLVTVRSFGSPSATAECGVRFLALGGLMIVSEPPDSPDNLNRWPAAPLAQLGLEPLLRTTEPFTFQVLIRTGPVPRQFPRRTGTPTKRPLF